VYKPEWLDWFGVVDYRSSAFWPPGVILTRKPLLFNGPVFGRVTEWFSFNQGYWSVILSQSNSSKLSEETILDSFCGFATVAFGLLKIFYHWPTKFTPPYVSVSGVKVWKASRFTDVG
jgi:hypothetical protein